MPVIENGLSPDWSYRSSGIIWRILVDETGYIVGESRDQQKKEASFFALSEREGTELWSGLTLDESWWVGMEAVERGILYLHTYEQPNLPAHQGIWAVDVKTGKILWQSPDVSFLFVHGENVYTHKSLFERRAFVGMNRLSGELADPPEIDHKTIQNYRQRALDRASRELCAYPLVYNSSQVSPKVAEIVVAETGMKDGGVSVEYALQGTILILSYYLPGASSSPGGPRYENSFCIHDMRENECLYRIALDIQATAPLPDTFFIREGRVYFVKDRHHLFAVRLPNKE